MKVSLLDVNLLPGNSQNRDAIRTVLNLPETVT